MIAAAERVRARIPGPQGHATAVERFPVRPPVLWAAIADHEGMSDWMGARVTVVAGPRDGGVGTVRRVHARGLTLDEEVTYADPPRRLVYRITAGLPVIDFHRGEILIEPWGETGSQLTWNIILSCPVPGVAQVMLATLMPVVRSGLDKLRRRLAQA